MLHLVTGVPGATKTAFVVTELDKVEKSNKVNLVKNQEFYKHNKPLMERYQEDFTYREYEIGSGHELRNQIDILPDDYFDFLGEEFDDLRPDYYFLRVVHFNEIIERITKREGDQGFKPFLPVRTIYTNINNLKIDYVRALTYDWRDCPDGSIVVIDEVQLVEPYDDIKNKNNEIVQSLTIHRHRGFDFWFITQSPSLLHPTVKVLIGVHYHLTRPYGMKTVVYRYGSAKDNPNAFINKQNREAKFLFTPEQRIFKLYKSTTINTHQKRFPKGILFFVFWVVLGIVFFFYNMFSGDLEKSSFVGDGTKQTNKTTQTATGDIAGQVIPGQTSTNTTATQPQNLTKEQLQEQLKVQEEQFKLELQKQKTQIMLDYGALQMQLMEQNKQINDFKRQMELIKTMLPKDHDIIKANPDLQVRGVVKMGNKCQAYNTHGVLMTLNKEQCTYYTDQPGRVWKTGQTVNNTAANNPRYPETLTETTTTTPVATAPATPEKDPGDIGLNEATKPVQIVDSPMIIDNPMQ